MFPNNVREVALLGPFEHWFGISLCRPFHALRPSTASLLLAAGVTRERASKITRHKDVRTFYMTRSALLRHVAPQATRQVEGFLARVAPFSDSGAASDTSVDGKSDGGFGEPSRSRVRMVEVGGFEPPAS